MSFAASVRLGSQPTFAATAWSTKSNFLNANLTFKPIQKTLCCRYLCHSLQKCLSGYNCRNVCPATLSNYNFAGIWAAAGTPRHVLSALLDQMKVISDAQDYDFNV
jgi:hypothetical protein